MGLLKYGFSKKEKLTGKKRLRDSSKEVPLFIGSVQVRHLLAEDQRGTTKF